MTISRRDFNRLLTSAAVAGVALPRSLMALAPRRQEAFFTWRNVGERIHVAFGQGGNAVLYRGGAEALMVDSKNLGYGLTLRREAEAMGTPLRQAMNTHHHGDHIGGNAVFRADLPLMAHPTAITRIREFAAGVAGRESEAVTRAAQTLRDQNGNPAVIAEVVRFGEQLKTLDAERFVPSRPLAASEDLRVGTSTVQLRHIGAGHTDNDVFVFFPAENVLHTGDLCFNGTHGFMDAAGGVTSEGWQRSVQAMLARANAETVVIPGHGEITGRASLQRQWDYFGQLRDAVGEARRQGMTREQVMELRPAALADVMGNPSRNLGVVFDELGAE